MKKKFFAMLIAATAVIANFKEYNDCVNGC